MALKPWPKGVSGNPGGRMKKPLIQKALEEALSANDSATARKVADRLVKMALNGSIAAAKVILDFTESKPVKVTATEKTEIKLTPEQIDQQLAALLRDPALKERLTKLMGGEVVQ